MVELLAHTPDPDGVCAIAANACVSKGICTATEMADGGEVGRSLKHALASNHDSVLEHAVFTFAVTGISRACSHQLVRHRIGASYSQQSQRYVSMDSASYVTPHTAEGDAEASKVFDETMDAIWDAYRRLEELGIPQEDARYILPEATQTNIVVTMNARELRHFLSLRLCNRAQWEIRELAGRMLELCREQAPIIFADAGPPCTGDGCRESRPCGRMSR